MRSYHLVLANDMERDIKAQAFEILANGTLNFLAEDDSVIIAYAPGAWLMVERENRDDRG